MGEGRKYVLNFKTFLRYVFSIQPPVSSAGHKGRPLSLVNLHYVVKDDFMPALTGDILVNISINDSTIFLLIFGPFMILFYNQLEEFYAISHYKRLRTSHLPLLMSFHTMLQAVRSPFYSFR